MSDGRRSLSVRTDDRKRVVVEDEPGDRLTRCNRCGTYYAGGACKVCGGKRKGGQTADDLP